MKSASTMNELIDERINTFSSSHLCVLVPQSKPGGHLHFLTNTVKQLLNDVVKLRVQLLSVWADVQYLPYSLQP